MKTKRCVGAVIYNDEMKIFLMTSPKWNCWVIPGGRIEDGESEEEALHREIKEELNINITNLVKVGEQMKEPSESFIDKKVQFHFINFFAKAMPGEIKTNEEIDTWGWFSITEALELNLLHTTKVLLEQFKDQHNL